MTAPAPRNEATPDEHADDLALLARLREDRPGPYQPTPCASGCDLARAMGIGCTSAVGRAAAMDRASKCDQVCRPRRAFQGQMRAGTAW